MGDRPWHDVPMRWFSRGNKDDRSPVAGVPSGPPLDPDPVFPVLSREDAATLMVLARETFAEHGRETVPNGSGALVGDGHVHGLANLAATLSTVPRNRWSAVVRRHVATMVRANDTVDPTSLDEARAFLLPKVRMVQDIPLPVPSYAPEVLPGVLAVAALDYPTHVSELLADARIAELGGWEAVREVAWQNLRQLPAPGRQDVAADPERDDATVHVLTSDDFFGASRVLVLDEVLAGIGVERPSHGVLVCIPNRHLLALHVLSGMGVIAAMNVMVQMARGECDARPGPVSPHVYYRAVDGQTQQVTRVDPDQGSVAVEVIGPLHKAFVGLGLIQ